MRIKFMTEDDRAAATRAYWWARKFKTCFAGLYASDDLVNVDGIEVGFFVTRDTTIAQLKAAQDDARGKRDVVCWSALIVPDDFFAEVEADGPLGRQPPDSCGLELEDA